MKPIIAVFGSNRVDEPTERLAEALGQQLVDEGYRIVCGGLGGVMAAVACGARASAAWTGSEVIGLLPGWTEDEQPNPWVDVALATGMGSMRNNLVARVADAAIAVAGGAGTLSELALAWHEGRPLAALTGAGGWAARLAGERLDDRRPRPIARVETVEQAIAWLDERFPRGVLPSRGLTRWWHEQVPSLYAIHESGPTGAQVEAGEPSSLAEVVGRLEALADQVRAWNRAHDGHRRALVTLEDGCVDALLLRDAFERLPELQPVLFVTAAHFEPRGGPEDAPVIGRDELVQLRDEGWLIGSHGPRHRDLRELPAAELGPALVEARRSIQRLGQPPWLAWPHGRWDERVASLARRAGFVLQLGLEGVPGPAPGPDLILRTPWR